MSEKARPGIPRDNTELIRNFGPFIANEIRKKNTVSINFDDAYQEVCVSLFRANVIEKFYARDSDEYPETMTLEEAITSLGTTPQKWRSNQSNYRYRGGLWMPDSINGAAPSSKKAVFRTSDILKIDDVHRQWRARTPVQPPARKAEPTPYQFLNYLGLAVRNAFANFCRTRSRKWQDCLGDQIVARVPRDRKNKDAEVQPLTARPSGVGVGMPQFRTAEGGYNDHWADTIRDDNVAGGMEARVELACVLNKLANRIPEKKHQEEIFQHIQDGYSLFEAIKLSSLPPIRKRVLAKVFA